MLLPSRPQGLPASSSWCPSTKSSICCVLHRSGVPMGTHEWTIGRIEHPNPNKNLLIPLHHPLRQSSDQPWLQRSSSLDQHKLLSFTTNCHKASITTIWMTQMHKHLNKTVHRFDQLWYALKQLTRDRKHQLLRKKMEQLVLSGLQENIHLPLLKFLTKFAARHTAEDHRWH